MSELIRRVRHKERKAEFEVLGEAEIEFGEIKLVVYRDEWGKLWAMLPNLFEKAFEEIEP